MVILRLVDALGQQQSDSVVWRLCLYWSEKNENACQGAVCKCI